MAIELNADDVFKMARQIEKDASAFYRRAASASGSPTCRQALLELASMEAEHEQVFASMKAELSRRRPAPAAGGTGKEVRRDSPDLTTMLISGVRDDLAERFTGRETDDEILRKALLFEKDTIVFFLHMKDYVPTQADKSRIDALVAEELGHMLKLTGQLASPRSQPARPARNARGAGDEEPRGRDAPLG